MPMFHKNALYIIICDKKKGCNCCERKCANALIKKRTESKVLEISTMKDKKKLEMKIKSV